MPKTSTICVCVMHALGKMEEVRHIEWFRVSMKGDTAARWTLIFRRIQLACRDDKEI
jgi:hypothetical protein